VLWYEASHPIDERISLQYIRETLMAGYMRKSKAAKNVEVHMYEILSHHNPVFPPSVPHLPEVT
jgi:hypothetical protein